MAKQPDSRVTLAELADLLQARADERDQEARGFVPGSDKRRLGMMLAAELARLAEEIRPKSD